MLCELHFFVENVFEKKHFEVQCGLFTNISEAPNVNVMSYEMDSEKITALCEILIVRFMSIFVVNVTMGILSFFICDSSFEFFTIMVWTVVNVFHIRIQETTTLNCHAESLPCNSPRLRFGSFVMLLPAMIQFSQMLHYTRNVDFTSGTGDVFVESNDLLDTAEKVGIVRDATIGLGFAFSVHFTVSLIVGIHSLFWTLEKHLKWHYYVYCVLQSYSFTLFSVVYTTHVVRKLPGSGTSCTFSSAAHVLQTLCMVAIAVYRRDILLKQLVFPNGPRMDVALVPFPLRKGESIRADSCVLSLSCVKIND